MEFLKGFLTTHSIVSFVIGLVPAGYFIYRLVRFIIRKEIRLFENLKRKVYLLKTGSNSLETEREMLVENGLYDVHDNILDLSQETKALQTLKNFAVFVVGYSQEYTRYQEIVNEAKSKNIPLVVFAKPGEIILEHMTIFLGYTYFEMCNTSARLLITIFNLSIVTPNEKI